MAALHQISSATHTFKAAVSVSVDDLITPSYEGSITNNCVEKNLQHALFIALKVAW